MKFELYYPGCTRLNWLSGVLAEGFLYVSQFLSAATTMAPVNKLWFPCFFFNLYEPIQSQSSFHFFGIGVWLQV